MLGLDNAVEETVSKEKESSMLSRSLSLSASSWSTGKVATNFDIESAFSPSVPASDERETEWNEEVEEAWIWPGPWRAPRLDAGG